jgi:hypothetical protein
MLAEARVAFDDELQRWIGASVRLFLGAISEGWSGTWNRYREVHGRDGIVGGGGALP